MDLDRGVPGAAEKRSGSLIDSRRAGQAAVGETHIDNRLRGKNQASGDKPDAEADSKNTRRVVGQASLLLHAGERSPGPEARNLASTCPLLKATRVVSLTRNAASKS
jgi:hypothetical protein